MSEYYPVALCLQGELCLVVGGGIIAYRKALSLLECGAVVRVVSPVLVPEMLALIGDKRVNYIEREFAQDDLEGVSLVIAATNCREVNQEIARLAKARCKLVNVADQPEECTFIIPAVHRAGALTLSVTTDGKSPALAGQIRRELEHLYPPEVYGLLLAWLGECRSFVLEHMVNGEARREILVGLAGAGLPALLKAGEVEQALQLIAEMVEAVPDRGELLQKLRMMSGSPMPGLRREH